jgi:hypothetical protein
MLFRHNVVTALQPLCLVLVATLLIAVPNMVHAIQAIPLPFQVVQPDGTAVTIQMAGDHRVRYDKDTNGFRVVKTQQQSKDLFVYAVFNTSAGAVVPTDKEVWMQA